jgi:hypothetical protein
MLRPSEKQWALIWVAVSLIITPVMLYVASGIPGGPIWPVYPCFFLTLGVLMWYRSARKK